MKKLMSWFAVCVLTGVIAGCGGGGGGGTTGGQSTNTGVATPASVSVVTAK